MKKIVAFILLTCMVLSLAACGEVKITMQEICDAGRIEAMLEDHQSVYIRDGMDGEFWNDKYLTKEYVHSYVLGGEGESDFAEFITDDVYYYYMGGEYVLYLPIAPDTVNSDFASYRAERYASADLIGESDTIESVSKKDGRITVKSLWSQQALEDMAEFGITSGKCEYVLNAKTREILSVIGDYTYDDGMALQTVTEVTYDAEEPETVKTFLKYVKQTEDLRNVTVVNNPGTEKEESKTVLVPKGLIIGLRYNEDSAYVFEVYTDAACTELYDPYADTDSDLTIYVKWNG